MSTLLYCLLLFALSSLSTIYDFARLPELPITRVESETSGFSPRPVFFSGCKTIKSNQKESLQLEPRRLGRGLEFIHSSSYKKLILQEDNTTGRRSGHR